MRDIICCLLIIFTGATYCKTVYSNPKFHSSAHRPHSKPSLRLKGIYHVPGLTSDPDALPSGVILKIFEDQFGSKHKLTNKYGISRRIYTNDLPNGYIDDDDDQQQQESVQQENWLLSGRQYRNNYVQAEQRKSLSHYHQRKPKIRRIVRIVHKDSPSELDENIVNNEVLRYFSFPGYGLNDDIF